MNVCQKLVENVLDVLFQRRFKELGEKGFLFVGSGVSGGEEGRFARFFFFPLSYFRISFQYPFYVFLRNIQVFLYR